MDFLKEILVYFPVLYGEFGEASFKVTDSDLFVKNVPKWTVLSRQTCLLSLLAHPL